MKTQKQEKEFIKEDIVQRFDWKLIISLLNKADFEETEDRLERRIYIDTASYIEFTCKLLLVDLGYDVSEHNEDFPTILDDTVQEYSELFSEIANQYLPNRWLYASFDEGDLFLIEGREL